jgi:hypothetical protein
MGGGPPQSPCPPLKHGPPPPHTAPRTPPPPLPPTPPNRYRLQLRPADQEFFRSNILEHFLPWRYHLAAAVDTPANAPPPPHPAARPGPAAGGAESPGEWTAEEEGGGGGASYPLGNETWWRLYQVACFMRGELQASMDAGLPLQVGGGGRWGCGSWRGRLGSRVGVVSPRRKGWTCLCLPYKCLPPPPHPALPHIPALARAPLHPTPTPNPHHSQTPTTPNPNPNPTPTPTPTHPRTSCSMSCAAPTSS